MSEEAPKSLNERLAEGLEAEGEKLLAVLSSAINAEKLYTIQCNKQCCRGSKFQASFPDINVMLNAAKWWTEYVHGKAANKPAPKEKPATAHLMEYTEMSDEALAELLGEGKGK